MKKKPDIALVLGIGKPKMGMDDEPRDEDKPMEHSEEQKAMAEELVDALKSRDIQGVLDSIHGIYASYMGMDSQESDEEEPSTKRAY